MIIIRKQQDNWWLLELVNMGIFRLYLNVFYILLAAVSFQIQKD